MEGDSDGAGKGRTVRRTNTLATTTPSPRATQRKHTSRLLDHHASTSTPSSSGTPRRPRLRHRQASCGVRMGTGNGDKQAAHALSWVLGVAVLLRWGGVVSAGALVSKKNTIALVRYPAAGLAARRAVLLGAWEGGRTRPAGGAVRRPTEPKDDGTMMRLWGKWGKYILDNDIGEAYTILSSGGFEKRGFASQAPVKSIKCNKVKTSKEMSGQGFSSTSVVHSSDGLAKKRPAGKAANKRRRRSPPFVEQRRIKAAEAETETLATTERALLEGETGEANVMERGEGPGLAGVGRLDASDVDASEVPQAETIAKGEAGSMRAVRMRKFLPPKRRHDRNKKNKNKSTGEAEGKTEVEVNRAAEIEPLEALEALEAAGAATCEVAGEVQLSGAAAAREIVIAAESTSWGKDLEEGEAAAGVPGGDDEKDGCSKPRVRKCPPAVGFVSGFRDVRLHLSDGGVPGDQGAASSSSSNSSTRGGMAVGGAKAHNGLRGPPGVEALIRALIEPLKSAPAPQHATAPRRWPSRSSGPDKPPSPRLSVGKNEAASGQADGVGVDQADTWVARVGDHGGGGGGSASSVKQKRSKPQPDAAQLLHPGAIEARGDEHLRIDPPMRCVSISFDPQADTLLSCITTNTDAFGEALHAPAVVNMSRADVAAYLERWLLVSVKYGVAPRELRTLLQENQGVTLDFGGGGAVEGRSDGFGVGREAGAGHSPATGKHHGSWDRGKWGSEDATSGGSWTKYGWKRLDRPSFDTPFSSSVSETAEDSSPPVEFEDESLTGRGSGGPSSPLSTTPRGYGADADADADVATGEVLESEGDDETEEEEMMESVAEALVGGDGGREADYEWIMTKAAPQEAGVGLNDSSASDGYAGLNANTQYSRLLEGNDASGMASGASNGSGGEIEGKEGGLKEARTSSLGWRVLEVVEARFKSGLHPPRIIAIGDVHGCLEELEDLVRKVEYWPGDLLLFLGDLVAKGPDSAGAVRLARELGGVTVRGNHEFEVLRWLNVDVHGDNRTPSAHHKIALSLSEEDATWLKASPWYFRCDDLRSLFVHAGFASGISMNKQNPRMMMNMRSVSASGLITSKVLETSPWARHWTGPDTVFFGHDAERGLQLMDHAVGIDTGCVYGGRLTACILPERRLVSVASKAAYIAYGKRRGSSSSRGSGSAGSAGKVKNGRSYGRPRSSSSENKPRR